MTYDIDTTPAEAEAVTINDEIAALKQLLTAQDAQIKSQAAMIGDLTKQIGALRSPAPEPAAPKTNPQDDAYAAMLAAYGIKIEKKER